VQKPRECKAIQDTARAFEEALPADQKKRLGQFFTGIPLGKLLAHLALERDTRTILDPMAGHGDLLDASLEAIAENRTKLSHLDGIEIDDPTASMCRQRLSNVIGKRKHPKQKILTGSSFAFANLATLPKDNYDLVITNPPYVRYQSQKGKNGQREIVRSQLGEIISERLSETERDVMSTLAENYSGLADLSVPAWILASILVKPGGRIALVVPATWRTRDYADVIQYLLLRCFSLEYVVEDTQPGWFSDALVRTHLIVARKLSEKEIACNLSKREKLSDAAWVQIAPQAASKDSLVGAAFGGKHPEAEFAHWLQCESNRPIQGISVRNFDLTEEWKYLHSRVGKKKWFQKLEGVLGVATCTPPQYTPIPDVLKEALSVNQTPGRLASLEDLGIRVGQGLRTGCNRFFYVTACDTGKNGLVLVQASPLFGNKRFLVPASILKPVLRRQSELNTMEVKQVPEGRVLDLQHWVLPEDYELANQAKDAYLDACEMLPKCMPEDLADFVRQAATIALDDPDKGRRIPGLSAVRTNVRGSRKGKIPPRFWYMIPNFAPRHLPAAFVARINHGMPWVEANFSPPILVDANFSTFWTEQNDWSPYALKALLNSTWCRAYMEALGTPLGGGALKLEATHLKRITVPIFSSVEINRLENAGKQLTRDNTCALSKIDKLVFDRLTEDSICSRSSAELARSITDRVHNLALARRKVA